MNLTTLIGAMAAILTTSAYIPQVIRIFKTRETKDISLLMYIILTTGIFLWLVYGLILRDTPIIAANGLTFIFSIIVMALKLKHG